MKPAPDRRLSSLKLKHGLWVKILSSLPTRGSSRLPAFFLLRHRAARASAACAQILPPQGRRSIWREHGVVRVCAFCAQWCIKTRAAGQNCAVAAQNVRLHDVRWRWVRWETKGCTHNLQLRLTCCVSHIAALCFTVLREICDEIFLHWSTTLSASPAHNLRMTCLLVPAILFYYYYYNYIYYYYY